MKNGIWEIDKHTKWALIESIEIDNINPQSAYDDVGGRIFIASSHRLYIYNLYANRLDSVSFAGHPYMGVSSQMIYDRGTDRLISYSPTIKKLNFYDFKRRVWSSTANIVVTMSVTTRTYIWSYVSCVIAFFNSTATLAQEFRGYY